MALQASPIEKGSLDVDKMNMKAEIGSPTPVLEQLLVKGWDSLDVLFQLKQNQDSGTTANCLVKLMMMQVPTSPICVTAFGNLTLLSLDACHRLRYLFSYSIAKLLVKLQEIKVTNCKVVEQLVQRERGDSLTQFPTQSNFVTVLENSSCNDRATIPQEACALEWPSLKRISIINCSMLEVVISKVEGKTDMITSFAQLQSLTLSYLPNVVSFCSRPCALEQPFLEKCHGSGYLNLKQDEVINHLLTLVTSNLLKLFCNDSYA